MELACHTGIPAREWLRDPAAMATAVDVLRELDERRNRKG